MEVKNCTRAAKLEVREIGEGEAKAREVRVTVSSEAPCVETVFDAETGEWVRAMEVLGHAEGEISFERMADGLVIQDTHDGDQVGLIRKPEIVDGKLGGVVEFCAGQRAQEIRADAEAGLRRNMSVGYFVRQWKKTDEIVDGLAVYRAVDWVPFEGSFVNVPADVRVGVDRALDKQEAANAAERVSKMPEEMKAEPSAELTAVRELKEEVAALREMMNKKPAMPEAKRTAELGEEVAKVAAKKYDLMKVVRSLAGMRDVDCGFEREISDEIAHRTGRSARGFFVPENVLMRAFDKGTAAAGLVATDTLFSEMVPALVAKTVLGEAGVRTLTGLVGDVAIPSAGSATAYWVSAEGGDATETTPAIGQIASTPKTVGAFTDITRKLMLQSGISAEAFVADALRSALARAIETAAFAGTGAAGQPTGLDTLSGARAINTVADATNPTLAKILEFVSTIDSANATGPVMKFIGQPAVWAKLGSTIDFANVASGEAVVGGVTSGRYLLDTATNTCQGYDFLKANLAPAKTLYFGDWSKLILAFWSGVDLTVDTASLSKSGGVRLVALQDMDVVCTQPKAFAKGQVIA